MRPNAVSATPSKVPSRPLPAVPHHSGQSVVDLQERTRRRDQRVGTAEVLERIEEFRYAVGGRLAGDMATPWSKAGEARLVCAG